MKQKTGIVILIIMLAIGFAAVTTTLYINGIIGIGTDKDAFDKDVVFKDGSIYVDNDANGNTTTTLSSDQKTITVSISDMKVIGDYKDIHFKISNYSQYDAIIAKINCYFVDDYEEGKKSTVKSYTNEYIELIPTTNLDGTKILAGGHDSDDAYVKVKQIKPYLGDKNNIDLNNDGVNDALEIKFQCEIVATAADSTVQRVNH